MYEGYDSFPKFQFLNDFFLFFLYFRIERVCEVKTEEEKDVKFQG